MKFTNIGPIKNANLTLGQLTIFSGGNNQGKTYITYAIYGVLKELTARYELLDVEQAEIFLSENKYTFSKEEFNKAYANFIVSTIRKSSNRILSKVFSSGIKTFEDSEILLDPQEVIEMIGLTRTEHFRKQIEFRNILFIFELAEKTISVSYLKKSQNSGLNTEEMLPEEFTLDRRFLNMVFSLIIQDYISNSFNYIYVPAERTGINVFSKELHNGRANFIDDLSTLDEDDEKIIKSIRERKSTYPQPVDEYVKYLNSLEDYDIMINESNKISQIIRDKMIGGRFGFDKEKGTAYFKLKDDSKVSLHMASSSAKSLYGLDYYLDSILGDNTNNFIIIDEPEINLHPSNQIEFAVLINYLIESGVNLIISTHSDFLMKKLANLALLNKIKKQPGISRENTKIYNFENQTLSEIDYFNKDNVFENFDKNYQNLENEYFNLVDLMHEEIEDEL
ncbi:AAA family ATPase [Kurthia sibirica]|nr:AAA family ATPase [Kurthia sibirica]GEK34840.1 ABC transporter ATP-binding protein [Kurthia sibirica]